MAKIAWLVWDEEDETPKIRFSSPEEGIWRYVQQIVYFEVAPK